MMINAVFIDIFLSMYMYIYQYIPNNGYCLKYFNDLSAF